MSSQNSQDSKDSEGPQSPDLIIYKAKSYEFKESLRYGSAPRVPITFGIELEFIYAMLYSRLGEYVNKHIDDLNPYQDILHYVRDTIIHSKGTKSEHEPPSLIPNIVAPHLLSTVQQDYINTWVITSDASVGAGSTQVAHLVSTKNRTITRDEVISHWGFRAVELVSAVLNYASNEWRLQFRQITKDLRAFPLIQGALNNRSTGMHVHLALEEKEFDLLTIKNLFVLYAVYEDQIDMLHPHHRRYNDYGASLRLSSKNYSHQTFAEIIYRSNTIEELERLGYAHLNGVAKYRRIHISPELSNKKLTIEFRQHRGTVDWYHINLWVSFCQHMLNYAYQQAKNGVIWMNPPGVTGDDVWKDLAGSDLLRKIGLPRMEANIYRMRIEQWKLHGLSDQEDIDTDIEAEEGSE